MSNRQGVAGRIVALFAVPIVLVALGLPIEEAGASGLDSTWVPYVYESWKVPVRRFLKTHGRSQPTAVQLVHRDTLLVRELEDGPAKTALVMRDGYPVLGTVRTGFLRRIDSDSVGLSARMERALQQLLDETPWTWPDSGFGQWEGLKNAGAESKLSNWAISLRKRLTGTGWSLALWKYDRGQDEPTEKVRWGTGPVCYLHVRYPLVYYISARSNRTRALLQTYDLEADTTGWLRAVEGAGLGYLDVENRGAHCYESRGFLFVVGYEAGLGYMELLDIKAGRLYARRVLEGVEP